MHSIHQKLAYIETMFLSVFQPKQNHTRTRRKIPRKEDGSTDSDVSSSDKEDSMGVASDKGISVGDKSVPHVLLNTNCRLESEDKDNSETINSDVISDVIDPSKVIVEKAKNCKSIAEVVVGDGVRANYVDACLRTSKR